MKTKEISQDLEENETSQNLETLEDRKKENIEYRGLCLTCKHTLFCTYQRDRTQPVLFCEEFNGDVLITNKAPTKTHLDTTQMEESLGKYLGLCKYCEIRETCKFPKPIAGVWHCKEYQ